MKPVNAELAKTAEFVCLEGIKQGNRFYSTNSRKNVTKLSNGTVAYRVIGYANTSEEALAIVDSDGMGEIRIMQALLEPSLMMLKHATRTLEEAIKPTKKGKKAKS
jgi:hypothetical protein